MGAKNKGLFFGKVVLGVWGFDLYHTRGVRKREEERKGGRQGWGSGEEEEEEET